MTEQTAESKPTIQQLMKGFSKQHGCERYSTDSQKISLLTDYLWMRQLTPTLPFETFLSLYTAVADFDDENLKHPADAIKKLLPRTKKTAAAVGTRQWSAREVVDYVALYIDMIREAESRQEPIPVDLVQFLTNEKLIKMFENGDFAEPAAPRTKASKGEKKKKAEAAVVRPSAAGDRILYTGPKGRQQRGVVTKLWEEPELESTYANIRTDAGEEIKEIGIVNLEKISDPPPRPHVDDNDQPLKEEASGRLILSRGQYGSAIRALQLSQPMGTVELGQSCYRFTYAYPDGHTAVLDVVNGETGPYVDAALWAPESTVAVAEVQPRKNLEGTYTFQAESAIYMLEAIAPDGE